MTTMLTKWFVPCKSSLSLCSQSVHTHVPQSSLTVPLSDKQKRKGLRGSVDLEKIKCVETVQPEPNAPQERMFAFQVKILGSLHFCIKRYLVIGVTAATLLHRFDVLKTSISAALEVGQTTLT